MGRLTRRLTSKFTPRNGSIGWKRTTESSREQTDAAPAAIVSNWSFLLRSALCFAYHLVSLVAALIHSSVALATRIVSSPESRKSLRPPWSQSPAADEVRVSQSGLNLRRRREKAVSNNWRSCRRLAGVDSIRCPQKH